MTEIVLTLFVDPTNSRSQRAIESVRALVQGGLAGAGCRLDVVDVSACPDRAERDRIVTTPTLVRQVGDKRRLVVGDMTRVDVVLQGLDLQAIAPHVEQLGAMTDVQAALGWSPDSAHRLDAWVDQLTAVIKPMKGRETVREYLLGLLRPGGGKSAKRMAYRGKAQTRSARYQALHHMVARAPWNDAQVAAMSRDRTLAALGSRGRVFAWVVGEHRIPRGGRSAVGLAEAPDLAGGAAAASCQRAVTLSCVTEDGAVVPAGMRLYLPPAWSEAGDRRSGAGVPEHIGQSEPWAIAIDLYDEVLAGGAPEGPLCADQPIAAAPQFAEALRQRGLGSALRTLDAALVSPRASAEQGSGPLPVHEVARRAGGPTIVQLDGPSVLALIEAGEGRLDSWLVSGPGAKDPSRFVEVPAADRAVYSDMGARAGLDGYTGRGWVGFHHHASLCMAAYAFLVSEERSSLG